MIKEAATTIMNIFYPHLMDERFSAMEADVVGRVRLRLLL